jgi:hypothetical protein
MTKMPVGLTPTRGYDREFTWGYERAAPPPARPLIPVVWDGLWLNTGDQGNGLCLVVERITGWLDSPPLDGNDVERVISDGAAWGPKVLRQRTIVITGAAAGPRDELGRIRDQLAARAASREPVLLAVGDFDLGRVLTADVRAGTELFRHTPLGSAGFRYQVAVTAADPALYDGTWQSATLTNTTEGTGREYPREYGWQYASPYVANSALLRNTGNYAAPVYALYEGDLLESALADNRSGIIRLARVDAGMRILVSTATLVAEAEGGLSRASYLLPGSRPMTVPPGSASRWFLRSAGRGSVTLAWRSTWV